MSAVATLVLLRHGESVWNAENLFTGWVDVPLSERGRAEAGRAGYLLREAELLPDIVHTSLLRRAISTANTKAGNRTLKLFCKGPDKCWRKAPTSLMLVGKVPGLAASC